MNRAALAAALALLLATTAYTTHPSKGAGTRAGGPGAGRAPDAVTLRWLSVTNWLLEAGETRILLDAGFTRVPESDILDWSWSAGAVASDVPLVERILNEVLPDGRLDWILVGHGHFDHALDAPALAQRTGARIAGSRTVCHQATALGVDPGRCRAVEGGEVLEVGPLRIRVVRWHHAGASSSHVGRLLRAPLELRAPPARDVATGGLRPGVHEDYPNGGGSRGYLITVATRRGPVTFLWTNTGNPEAWDQLIDPDSLLLRERGTDMTNLEWAGATVPTRDALAEALRDEGLGAVDLWIGMALPEHVRQVAHALRPTAFIPHHWDSFWDPVLGGVRGPFANPAVMEVLAALGVEPVIPLNYFDRFRLEPGRVLYEGDSGARARLGVPEPRR